MTTANSTPESGPAAVRRVVIASFMGTMIEWYDFFLYGTAAALVFDKLFFPGLDPVNGKIAAYGTFALGFFARPVGGIVFAHFGDRMGRKSVLITSLMMMGVATFLIGTLPTYESAGIWAPVLLVSLRFVQGFGVGGEWGGAVLMVVEHGHKGKRGFYGSWVQAGVPVGLLLANGVFALCTRMPDADFLAWGWRIPFLLGIVLLVVGMFIRLQIAESPLFTRLSRDGKQAKLPILQVLKQHPRNVVLAMGMRFAENASFYIFTVFAITYATDELGLPKSTVLNGILLAAVAQLVAIPFFGGLSDRVGRRPVYMAGAVATLVYPFVFFALFNTQSVPMIWLAIILSLIIHSAMYGPQAAFLSELFGTNVRYSGASLGYQLAAPFAGGLAPMIAAVLLDWSGGAPWAIAGYLSLTAVITIVSVWLAEETHEHDLK
jgi:MFS transporter, MHS family, shikimate and dehydroshikimate transport protein